MTSLADLFDLPQWHEKAQCRGTTQAVFFTETMAGRIGGKRVQLESIGKSICRVCEVQEECLEFALTTNQTEGIWGGYTPSERRRLKRRRAQRTA